MLQSDHQNPKWLPKWLLTYLKFNVDGLEDHLIPLCIKGCKTIPEVGAAIRLPESKMAAKMAAKMKQTLKTFFNAIRTPFSRHTALSYSVYCAMERLLLLDIACVAPRNDAYADVVSWVHRDADDGIMFGYAAHCSLRGSR